MRLMDIQLNTTYPDDAVRYPNAHGKTIKIASTWIGSTESTVGDKKYKVILDFYTSSPANIRQTKKGGDK